MEHKGGTVFDIFSLILISIGLIGLGKALVGFGLVLLGWFEWVWLGSDKR